METQIVLLLEALNPYAQQALFSVFESMPSKLPSEAWVNAYSGSTSISSSHDLPQKCTYNIMSTFAQIVWTICSIISVLVVTKIIPEFYIHLQQWFPTDVPWTTHGP